MGRVYISQREGASGYAGRVSDALTAQFGHGHVVMAAGVAEVRNCDAMAVLIDRQWLVPERSQSHSLQRDGDPVRQEISAGLAAGLRVIPVLLEGAVMPVAAELPDDVAPLVRRQALRIDDDDWSHDIERLGEALAATAAGRLPISAATASGLRSLRTFSGETNLIGALAFSEDGVVVSGWSDGRILVQRTFDGKLLRAITAHRERVTSLALAAGHLVTGSTDGFVRVWQAVDLAFETELPTASRIVFWLHRHFRGEVLDTVLAAAIAPDGATIAFGDGGGTVRLCELAYPGPRRVGSHDDCVTALGFSPDGAYVASGGWDGTIRLYAIDKGQEVATMTTPERQARSSVEPALAWHLKPSWWINGLCFSADGETIACAGGYGKLQLWSVKDCAQIASWQAHEHNARSWRSLASGIGLGTQAPLMGGISCLAYGPGDETIATGGDDTHVRLWRTSDGTCLADLTGHVGGITSVAFSPNGRQLASASWDGTVTIWGVSAFGRQVAG